MKISPIRKIIIVALLGFSLQVLVPAGVLQAASAKDQFNSGLNSTAQGTGHLAEEGNTAKFFQGKNLSQIIGKTIKAILSFLGIIFFVLTIYAGFIWMLARGNEQEVTKAKDILKTAIVGIIIVLAAYALTIFVGAIFTETSEAGCPPGQIMQEDNTCADP